MWGKGMAKVLIIDDSKPIRETLKAILASENHKIFEAVDGDSGVDMARETTPDLIILDMNMPKMTGWEVAPILRTHPNTRNIPIIALTADQSTQGREKAYEAGCDIFVTKPIDAGRLLLALSAVSENYNANGNRHENKEKQALRRVLVVDNDRVMRSLLTAILKTLWTCRGIVPLL
jgi:CheY-like chemotaxis protein